MRTRIYRGDINELLLEAEYPSMFYDTDSEITERHFSAEIFLGKGSYHEMYFEGVHIGYGDIALSNHTLLQIESDFEAIKIHFSLCGNTFTSGEGINDITFGCNEHNIFYADGFKGKSEWSASSPIKVFEVNLMPSFFKKYLPDEVKLFNKFSKKISKRQSGMLSPHNLRITPQMHLLIQEVIHCNRVGKFKRMLIEARVIELLMLQLEQMSEHESESFCSLKKADIDKMHLAKQIIIKNLDKPCTLISLAQQVGTNEFTLKKGFKEVFGTTVFGFANEYKMHQAKKMLVEEGLPVFEVSEIVGYKNPQHFSTAFKKFYGKSPSQLKV